MHYCNIPYKDWAKQTEHLPSSRWFSLGSGSCTTCMRRNSPMATGPHALLYKGFQVGVYVGSRLAGTAKCGGPTVTKGTKH